MDATKFRGRVEFFVPEAPEKDAKSEERKKLADVVTGHSIGIVALNDQENIRVGIIRTQGTPIGEPGVEGEGYRVHWTVVTASVNPSDDSIHYQETPADEVIGSDVAKLQAGESPWLPDDALVVASQTREFFPGLYYPGTGERFQIQFRPGAQNDV